MVSRVQAFAKFWGGFCGYNGMVNFPEGIIEIRLESSRGTIKRTSRAVLTFGFVRIGA